MGSDGYSITGICQKRYKTSPKESKSKEEKGYFYSRVY
jgi:hypothetical protein